MLRTLGSALKSTAMCDNRFARAPSLKNVVVLMYGLMRSSTPLPGLQQNLLNPFKAAGIKVDMFMHTYIQGVCNMPDGLEVSSSQGLRAIREEISSVQMFTTPICEAMDAMNDALSRCDRGRRNWKYGWTRQLYVRHMLQLYSLQEVTALAVRQAQVCKDTIIVRYRPDTIIDCPILPNTVIGKLGQKDMLVPLVKTRQNIVNDR